MTIMTNRTTIIKYSISVLIDSIVKVNLSVERCIVNYLGFLVKTDFAIVNGLNEFCTNLSDAVF